MSEAAPMADAGLYERDFYAWTQAQAGALRRALSERVNYPLDWENLAEEIESLGGSQRNEIESRLETLIEHLLKLAFSSPADPRRGWKLTVFEQRRQVLRRLNESSSLRSYPGEVLMEAYEVGRRRAEVALDLDDRSLPLSCPFDLNTEVLAADWYPEPGWDQKNA